MIQKSGKTSTTSPIKRGTTGDNASVTYYWAYDSNVVPEFGYFTISKIDTLDSSTIHIGYFNDKRKVTVGDMIVYSDKSLTRNFIVIYVDDSSIISNTYVKTIGSYSTGYDDYFNNLSIDFSFVPQTFTETILSGGLTVVANPFTQDGTVERAIGYTNMLLRTQIKSTNKKTFGKIKITLEFYINNISPAMDTIMMEMFNNHNFPSNYTEQTGVNELMDVKTYRGYIGAYHMWLRDWEFSGDNVCIRDFDNEKLDNFTIILKDFNEYTEDTEKEIINTINKKLLHQHIITHIDSDEESTERTIVDFDYKCFLFVYVPTVRGDYIKKCLGEVTLPAE